MKKLVIYVEDVLVKTLSGNPLPKALWDYKINWPIWNAIRQYDPQEICIVSNEPWIWRGWVKNHDYWCKLDFIASCLSNFLGITAKKPRIKYSIEGDWKGWKVDTEELLDRYSGWDFVGPDQFQKYIEQKNLTFINISKFLKTYGTTAPRREIQGSQKGNNAIDGNSNGTTSSGSTGKD